MDSNIASTDLDAFEKVKGLWYNDGNVIFCSGKKMFRLHRSILCDKCPVFNDMFGLPQGNEDAENWSERQHKPDVINLPDSDEDLYYFFLSLSDTSFYPNSTESIADLAATVSILRLAHKYDVQFLVRRAVQFLHSFFPSDRGKLHEVAEFMDRSDESVRGGDESSPQNPLKILIDLLSMSYITEVNWISPFILYVMVMQSNGLMKFLEHPSYIPLPNTVKYTVIKGFINDSVCSVLQNSWLGVVPTQDCSDLQRCWSTIRTLQNEDRDYSLYSKVPFFVNGRFCGVTLCDSCCAAGKEYNEKIGNKIWDQYASACGYMDWESVMKERTQYLETLSVSG